MCGKKTHCNAIPSLGQTLSAPVYPCGLKHKETRNQLAREPWSVLLNHRSDQRVWIDHSANAGLIWLHRNQWTSSTRINQKQLENRFLGQSSPLSLPLNPHIEHPFRWRVLNSAAPKQEYRSPQKKKCLRDNTKPLFELHYSVGLSPTNRQSCPRNNETTRLR